MKLMLRDSTEAIQDYSDFGIIRCIVLSVSTMLPMAACLLRVAKLEVEDIFSLG